MALSTAVARFPTRTVRPGSAPNRVWSPNEQAEIDLPKGWVLLPKGDPAATRRLRSSAERWWLLEERPKLANGKWGKAVAAGTYAPKREVKAALRAAPKSAKAKKVSATMARERREERDIEELRGAIVVFLDFAPKHRRLAAGIADKASEAAKIGSGRVGRTKTQSVAANAELAARAHIRHAHTDYDDVLDRARKPGAKQVTRTSKKYARIRREAQRQVDEFLASHRR